MRLEGRRALVTGGASGIGAATARRLAAEGADVVIGDLNEEGGASVAGEISATAARLDVTDPASAGALAEEHGPFAILVNNAGMDEFGFFADTDPGVWERVIAVNLIGTAAVVRAALPALERSRGRVVTVASTLGLRALPAATAYCASKFGVVGFTRALAAELGDRVGVTLLVPGGMRTHFFDDRPDNFKPAPDQHLNDPADVARTVVFALRQPAGCELRELVVAPASEPSWP